MTKAQVLAVMQDMDDDAAVCIGLTAASLDDMYECNTNTGRSICEIVAKEVLRVDHRYLLLIPYDDPISGIE